MHNIGTIYNLRYFYVYFIDCYLYVRKINFAKRWENEIGFGNIHNAPCLVKPPLPLLIQGGEIAAEFSFLLCPKQTVKMNLKEKAEEFGTLKYKC